MGTLYTDNQVLERLAVYPNVVLYDTSWHLMRSFHAHQALSILKPSGTIMPTGHLYGTLRAMTDIRCCCRDAALVLCQDRHAQHRYDMYPEYKAGRPKLIYNVFEDTKALLEMAFGLRDVYTAMGEALEADDVMIRLAKDLSDYPGGPQHIFIFTGDKDAYQSISNKVAVIRKIENGYPVFITDKNVMEDFGVVPEKLLWFRSVIGDTSDSIKGIARFNRKMLVLIVGQAESFEDMFIVRDSDKLTKLDKHRAKLVEGRSIVERNFKLMQPGLHNPIKLYGDYDVPRCLSVCNELSMNFLQRFIQAGEIRPAI